MIEGAVEATSIGTTHATSKVVSEAQAVRFVGTSVEPVGYEAGSYNPPKPSVPFENIPNYVPWSFEDDRPENN